LNFDSGEVILSDFFGISRQGIDLAHLHRPREVAMNSQNPKSRPVTGAAPG
jgi:hypothetical protein